MTFAQLVSGVGALTKLGGGRLTLTGLNTYGGGTNINAGTLQIGADANLGAASGGLIFNGGTLQFTNAVATARTVALNAGGGSIDAQATADTVSGAISGVGALTKVGGGTLTLTGDNTYSRRVRPSAAATYRSAPEAGPAALSAMSSTTGRWSSTAATR